MTAKTAPTLFDRTEVAAHWRSLPLPRDGAVRWRCFDCRDFPSSSEQSIDVARGAREDFLGPMHFWISAYFAASIYVQPVLPALINDEEGERIEAALCEPISRDEFLRVVNEYSRSLTAPLPDYLRELRGWRGGMRLYDEWNWVQVLAQLDEGYVWFDWGTSA